jgi:hypothetical protein
MLFSKTRHCTENSSGAEHLLSDDEFAPLVILLFHSLFILYYFPATRLWLLALITSGVTVRLVLRFFHSR